MSNSSRLSIKEAFGLITVVVLLGLLVWGIAALDDKSSRENCENKYHTSGCLKRMLEEVEAKEAYKLKIKEIKDNNP